MTKSFYSFANFFLGLAVVAGLFQSLIHFQLGAQMYFLQPYVHWFLVVNIVSLVGTLCLLKYFHDKQYGFTFRAGVINTLVFLCQFILIYITLLFVARELEWYNILMLFLYLGTGSIFALSLIFSRAGERPWLKAAGVFMLPTYLIFGSVFTYGLVHRDFLLTGTYEKINQWATLANSLVPVLFIMNFLTETKSFKAENPPPPIRESLKNAFDIGIAIAFMCMVILGSMIAKESYWALDWKKRAPEVAQQLAKPFEARTYVNREGDTLRYLFMKPLDYDAAQQYPLVVCLHGGPVPLNTDKDRHVNIPEPAPLLSNQVNRKKYPAFIFVPQGPPGHTWGGIPNLPAVDSLVFETIHALEEEYAIDDKRRYVAEGSMGGYGAWHFIGMHPDMFAAALPYCGAGNPALAQNMVDVPVWAFHGSIDRNVPVRGSRDMIEAIKEAGGNPLYTEFPGVGHNVWPHINETPGVLDWLFAQERD